MSEIILDIHHLSKTFGTNVVLRDIDFSVSTGDVTCIIGASRSGKSTLLRCLNLLETPHLRRGALPRKRHYRNQGQRSRLPGSCGHGISEF